MAKVRRRGLASLGTLELEDEMRLVIGPPARGTPAERSTEEARLRRIWAQHGRELLRAFPADWALATFGDPTGRADG
jgi:hypothetical protein